MAMTKDSQTRKWMITSNNPEKWGYNREKFKEILSGMKSVVYWCMSDEIGNEKGTPHTHIFIYGSSAIRFSTLQNNFPKCDLQMQRGTCLQNRNYVFKEGEKWGNDEKADTSFPETHEEHGDLPVERQGARNDLEDLFDMIKGGMSNFDIITQEPRYMTMVDKIERTRQILREEKYKDIFRNVEVHYVYGDTGTGKSRDIFERYGYSNVYKISDYDHPFDDYQGQDVIVFEEFRSSLKVSLMLQYIDGYPLRLPCRYFNKVACFTKVYFATNISLQEQYVKCQIDHPKTWKAFLRRINDVTEYLADGRIEKREKPIVIDIDDVSMPFAPFQSSFSSEDLSFLN